MSSKTVLMLEPLSDDEPPITTADDWEVNPGDKYCQLGDSATARFPVATVRALKVTETNAVVALDVGPKTGERARPVLCFCLQ